MRAIFILVISITHIEVVKIKYPYIRDQFLYKDKMWCFIR